MPVRQASMDLLSRRVPQLFRLALKQALLLPLRLPGPPLRSATKSAARWLSLRTVAAAVLLGGIVHICATFASSVWSIGYAYQQLREKLPLNRMTVLPLQAPGRQILPYLAPDMLYAMCRYDLSGGPVAVSAAVLGRGWALSLHTPQGGNFYVLPGQAQRRTNVTIVVVPSAPDAQSPIRRESAADGQIASPTMEGLVVLRGPLRGLAWAAETEATLQAATCTPMKQ